MATIATRRREVGRTVAALRPLAESMRKHRVTTHATAIAFRVLVSLVPLALLGIGVLGALGLQDVWNDTVYPELQSRLAAPVAVAADFVVQQIFADGGAGLILFASALLVWNTSRAVRSVERALNEIHETEEERPHWRALLVVVGLAVATDVLLLTTLLAVVVGGRIDGWATATLRWPIAIVLLWACVTLLVRYAPAEQPETRWASAGSAFVVAAWLVASAAFGYWTTSIASYRSAVGSLTAFLVLTAYTLVVSYVFVVGVELDEAVRRGGLRKSSR